MEIKRFEGNGDENRFSTVTESASRSNFPALCNLCPSIEFFYMS